MSDDRGIYHKYRVERTDGADDGNADYFILCLNGDAHARNAALAYAESVKDENPRPAFELLARVRNHEKAGLR